MKLLHLREGYEAFVLDEQTRQMLAKHFPSKYSEFIGHHITNMFGVPQREADWGSMHPFEVVGYAHDDGIEALVVSRGGKIQRPDGKPYHITWSLDRSKGWKPADSNRVITEGGFTPVERGICFEAPFKYLT